MSQWVCYTPDDGDIKCVLGGSAETVESMIPSGCEVLEYAGEAGYESHYVKAGAVVPKTEFPGLKVRTNRITEIPKGTLVSWPDGYQHVENSGTISYEANSATELWFFFEHPQYLRKRVKVKYNPS